MRIDVGALGARAPGGLEPDPGAAADHDDGLAEQLGLALGGWGDRFDGHRISFCQLAIGGPAPTGLRAAAISRAERLQRGDVDLRERRERLDRVAQDVERDVGADRQRGLLQPLARLGAERVGAGQPLAVAEERQEAVALGVRARVGGGLRRPPRPGPWR